MGVVSGCRSPPAPGRHCPTPATAAPGQPHPDSPHQRSGREGTEPAARPGAQEEQAADRPALGWSWSLRSNNQSHATVRSIQEPHGDAVLRTPAERMHLGRGRAAEPATAPSRDADSPTVPAPIRITAREAGVLQTFPADYPWLSGGLARKPSS